MLHFFRLIDHHFIDFFVQKAEDSGDFSDQILKYAGYLLGHRELYIISGYITEQAADGFVVAEVTGDGGKIVLQTSPVSRGDLICEVRTLTLSEAEMYLAVLDDHLQCPLVRVKFPRLDESKFGIGGEQSVPFPMMSASDQENPEGHSSEGSIKDHIVVSELTAVFTLIDLLTESDKCRGSQVPLFSAIFVFAFISLNHYLLNFNKSYKHDAF